MRDNSQIRTQIIKHENINVIGDYQKTIQLLEVSITACQNNCKNILGDRAWFQLSNLRQDVVTNMIYNLGPTRFQSLKNFTSAIIQQKFNTAANEIRNSNWAKKVKFRADILAMQMETNK
jgi:GH24 family phage-related lysozyme (muramidase)